MSATDEILELIDERLGRAREQISVLDRARAALASSEVPSTERANGASPRRHRARKRRSQRPRRALGVVPAGKLEVLLGETPGLTTGALADRANGEHGQVLTLLRELEAAGRIRRTGERRATRWFFITDEDRIQARAAELAAMTKPPL